MSQWLRGSYVQPMRALARQLDPNAPEGHEVGTERLMFGFPRRSVAFAPDLHVANADLIDIDADVLPGEALSLAAELTSDTERDRYLDWRLDVHGASNVPVYLLLDMNELQVAVYSGPFDKGYRSHTTVEFGKPVHVPAPFDFELDTAAFKRED